MTQYSKILETKILETELIFNTDGSVYHLNLLPDEIADIIILVGDPDRVPIVSKYFDRITVKKQKREFITHTGYIGQHAITVISTGIGVGNIDIVLNEIDALVNIDFTTRTIKKNRKRLRIIRLGTCGGLKKEITVNSLVLSTYAFAFDGIMQYYVQSLDDDEHELLHNIKMYFSNIPVVENAYVGSGAREFIKLFSEHCIQGMTLTCPGFYGPQRRRLRLPLIKENIFTIAESFKYKNESIVNVEMETATLYSLGKMLDHDCCSISTVIANRIDQQVSKNPKQAVEKMIKKVLLSLQSLST